jgi:tRNA modification GTPase
VILADTAGLREAADPIEAEGLRRARRRADEAEIRLFVFDARSPGDAAAAAAWPGPDTFLVANKIDLLVSARLQQGQRKPVMPGLDPGIHETTTGGAHCGKHVDGRVKPSHDAEKKVATGCRARSSPAPCPVSALTGEGVDALLGAITTRIAATYRIETPVLTRARHRAALEDAAASLDRALSADLAELRAEDLRLALRGLGRITGTVDVEDLLDIIFRDFCLGK